MRSFELDSSRIELISVKERLKALNLKERKIYFGVFALIFIIVYFLLSSLFAPPSIPDFELQVNDWHYNPLVGSFIISGTIGMKVPPKYEYKLELVSITDGNESTTSFSDLGSTSVTFEVSLWNTERAGPDWTFLIGEGIALESKNVQLTLAYEIRYGGSIYAPPDVLETGTEVFSVNIELEGRSVQLRIP